MRKRVSTVLKEHRTQAQLEKLKESITLGTAAKRFPMKSYEEEIGWEINNKNSITQFPYGPQETFAYMAFEIDGVYSSLHHVFRQMTMQKDDRRSKMTHDDHSCGSRDVNEVNSHTSFKPKSVLDYGGGPGTASWVAKEFFGTTVNEYRIIEPSQSMLGAAQSVLEGFPGLSFRKTLAEMKRDIEKGRTYDLILLSYVLSELMNDMERIAVVSTLWNILADGGRMVIVDRGNSWGSLQVRSARQFILDSLTTNQDDVLAADSDSLEPPHIEGGRLLGPCPHQNECPMKEGEWCHFVQRTPRVIQPRLPTAQRWAGYQSIKFSYVTFEKRKSHNSRVEEPNTLARLTRGPLLSTRQVILDICHPNGKTERRSVTKGKAFRDVYRHARKAHWGAQWPAQRETYEMPKKIHPPKVRKPRHSRLKAAKSSSEVST
jgi:ribosomal protein RSM22 (predicted rRNA methylase)